MLYTNFTQKIYWSLNFGKMPLHLTDFQLLTDRLKQASPSIFFLSTGRTGTLWFAHLFSKAKNVVSFHEPFPQLHIQSVFAYNLWNSPKTIEDIKQILMQIFLAGRADYILRATRSQKKYIETNHYLTFFAPIIADILPNAKFVHIYRHPGDFVRSGLIRNWYGKNNPKNITLIKGKTKMWENMSQIEKLAWLWNETNLFIENFKKSIDSKRIFSFNFSELDIKKIEELIKFADINLSIKKVQKLINKPINKHSKTNIPHYKEWSKQNKKKVASYISTELRSKYNFDLY